MPSLDTHNNNLRNANAATETFSGHTRRLSRCKSDSEMIRQVYRSNACLSTRLIAARSLSSKCTSPEENLCLDKSTPHTWSTFTMFVAGLPRGIPPSASLQRSLVQFLSQWAPVESVKLITYSSNGQLKCVFADFANEDDATKALKGVQTSIFYYMHLRLEPARGDRTLRFTMYDANMPYINVSYIWIQTNTSKMARMYQPKRAQDFPHAALTKKLLFDLASLFGGIDLVKEKTTERKPCFDVVFQHRDAAYSALRQLSAHAPMSNLCVRWCMSDIAHAYGPMPDNCVAEETQHTYVHQSLPYLNYHGPVWTPIYPEASSGGVLTLSNKQNMVPKSSIDQKQTSGLPHKLDCILHSSNPFTVHVSTLGSKTSVTKLCDIFGQFGPLHMVTIMAKGQASVTFKYKASAKRAYHSLCESPSFREIE